MNFSIGVERSDSKVYLEPILQIQLLEYPPMAEEPSPTQIREELECLP
jgi:hypothetical protein